MSSRTDITAKLHADDKFMERKDNWVPSKKEMKHYLPYLEVAVSWKREKESCVSVRSFSLSREDTMYQIQPKTNAG